MDYFYNYINSIKDKTINIYIDMDGVVADYDFEGYNNDGTNPDIYLNKRPIYTTINIFKKLSELENVNLYILSVSRYNSQVDGKLKWLDEFLPFIKKENINIIPRDTNDFKKANLLKREFLIDRINNDDFNIHIDDAHDVLVILKDLREHLKVLHITSILD